MVVSLDEAKLYLRVDSADEDALISTLIEASEEYLRNATGREFDEGNRLAKLFCLALVTDWYENRQYTGRPSENVRPILTSILAQLNHCYEDPAEEEEG